MGSSLNGIKAYQTSTAFNFKIRKTNLLSYVLYLQVASQVFQMGTKLLSTNKNKIPENYLNGLTD